MEHLITIAQLQKRLSSGKKLLVFGVSENSRVYLDSMKFWNLDIEFILDNDISRNRTVFHGITVLNPSEISDYSSYIIVVASVYYADIIAQLEEMGIGEYYELSDINASSCMETLRDDENLVRKEPYIGGEDTFVYVGDGFGDNIIKYPILERLSKEPDADSYYFLTSRQANYDIYSSLFKNVFIYDKDRIETDHDYHHYVMTKVIGHRFKTKLCFCHSPYFHTHFDPFGRRNTNIPNHKCFYECLKWENGRVKENATEGLQRMADYFWDWKDFNLTEKGAFSNILVRMVNPVETANPYICFAMGGISWGHVYKAERIAEVVKWFIRNSYRIILLGYGEKDEEYNRKVIKLCNGDTSIVNLTSKCSPFESLKIIEDSELFIGLDSALTHGVYALDKKGIVLMSGNSFSQRFVHKGEPKLIYLTEKMECLGCYRCVYGKWNNQMEKMGMCFSNVSPKRIIDAANRLIERKKE